LLTIYLYNNLLNSFQSPYIKHHSTEIALLSVHDHIIKAMSHQKVTYLTLLDLSAACDTVDHSILLNHLYSNSFMEFLKNSSLVLYSSSHTPLLSSTVISITAANHHLYADDRPAILQVDKSGNVTSSLNTGMKRHYQTEVRSELSNLSLMLLVRGGPQDHKIAIGCLN